MGLVDPHPALKAAVPMYPMVDGWIGDDFYHNGAFRQTMLEWIYEMGSHKSSDHQVPYGYRDLYEAYLSAGSADAGREPQALCQLAARSRPSGFCAGSITITAWSSQRAVSASWLAAR